jgi:tRNA(adenine34) deaminase
MQRALALAERAAAEGEVPVGAVLVKEGQELATGWNASIQARDPTAHAEIVAIRNAARRLKNYRLPGTTLYVTIEPCTMCAGAIIQARLSKVVYGAADAKAGAAGSVYEVLGTEKLNHRVDCSGGLFAEEAAAILQRFFAIRRGRGRVPWVPQ